MRIQRKPPLCSRSLVSQKKDHTPDSASIVPYPPNPRGLAVLVTGRSSGLSILILLRLPRRTPSDWHKVPEAKLLSYSDGFAQAFHLLPFSPDPKRTSAVLSDTCNNPIHSCGQQAKWTCFKLTSGCSEHIGDCRKKQGIFYHESLKKTI